MSFGGIFDLETLQSQQDELEKMMSAPGFWDNNEKAAKISEEHASAAKKINLFGSLESRVSDKLAGDVGHPVQYETGEKQWYVNVATAATENNI